MEGLAQAQAYAEADFSQANSQFLHLFSTAFPAFTGHASILDLGCGPGQILFDFAQKFPDCTCLGIDGSAAMLSHGSDMTKGINGSSVTLQQCYLPLASNFGKWQVVLSRPPLSSDRACCPVADH